MHGMMHGVMHGVMHGRSKHAFANPRAHLPCGPPMWAAQDSSLLPTIHRLVHRLFVRLVPFANAPPPHVPFFFRTFFSPSFIAFHSASPFISCVRRLPSLLPLSPLPPLPPSVPSLPSFHRYSAPRRPCRSPCPRRAPCPLPPWAPFMPTCSSTG